jgi:Protein of unknown function (DUF1266)
MVESPYVGICFAVLVLLLVVERIARPRLTAGRRWALAAGANMARMRGDSLETLAIRLPRKTLREMLLKGWKIRGPEDVEARLDWLDREGHTSELRIMLHSIAALPPRELEAWLGQFDQDLQRAARFAQQHREAFKDGEIVAWDLVRLIFVARAAFSAGYLDEAKAWQHVGHAARRLRSTYRSWGEMSENYLLGRRYWGEGDDLQQNFDAAAHWLLTDKKSPWRRLDWGIAPDQLAS